MKTPVPFSSGSSSTTPQLYYIPPFTTNQPTTTARTTKPTKIKTKPTKNKSEERKQETTKMNPLSALEQTLEKTHHYKKANQLRSLNKALTLSSNKDLQKAWLAQMWEVTYTLDDLEQRKHFLETQIILNKGATLQLQSVFEHLLQKPKWSTAKDVVQVMEGELEIVQREVWDLQDRRFQLFKERPGGAWIRELAVSVERNEGRDFWEKGRRECIRAKGCCARNCGCCTGWFLHCSESCPCCLFRNGEVRVKNRGVGRC